MKRGLMTAAVLTLILGTGLQASANQQQNDAQCTTGTVVGGVIGGLLGNGASKGNAGATILGAGVGALLGSAVNCDGANANVSVNVGPGPGDDRGPGYGRGGPGYGPGPGDDRGGDWGHGRPNNVVSYDLIQEAWEKSFDPRNRGQVVVSEDGETVKVLARNLRHNRNSICQDYSMQEWGRGRSYDQASGTICKDLRSGDVYEQ